jgi:hypothetical protein
MMWHQYPQKEGSLSEYATVFEIVDEGAGEFIKVMQPFTNNNDKGIAIDKDEWKKMKHLIDNIFDEIKKHEHEGELK